MQKGRPMVRRSLVAFMVLVCLAPASRADTPAPMRLCVLPKAPLPPGEYVTPIQEEAASQIRSHLPSGYVAVCEGTPEITIRVEDVSALADGWGATLRLRGSGRDEQLAVTAHSPTQVLRVMSDRVNEWLSEHYPRVFPQ
jgi:hypothetical protein